MYLPERIRFAMRLIEKAGRECWLVGGCVRDTLRGVTPHDYDLATDTPPRELLKIFDGFHCILAGLSHGTVSPVIGGSPVEITAYRTESGYSDHRRPDSVRFAATIEEDLSRRDFTVNAMAWHPRRGLCDPFGGQFDLDCRLIRAVGEPARRFDEDALRILRALRFAASLDFEIEPQTAAAMNAAAPTLALLARERVTEELRGILSHPRSGALAAAFSPVFAAILPWPQGERLTALSEALSRCDGGYIVRLTLIAHFSGALDARLTLTRDEAKSISRLLSLAGAAPPETAPQARQLLSRFGTEDADAALALWHALGRDTEKAGQLILGVIERGDCVTLAQLALKGARAAELVPQEEIGALLKACLLEVMEDKIANTEDETSAFAVRYARGIVKNELNTSE